MKYMTTGSVDPYYNLAFEEYVLLNRLKDTYFMLWQNKQAIILGQNQDAVQEVNKAFTDENNIVVVRRCTGGGTVFHDLGNINYTFIMDYNKNDDNIVKFTEPIVESLRLLGLPAELSGRNDILIGNKKVSGVAHRIENGRILHHGTLLFETDLEMMTQALAVDREKLRTKGIQSVSSRVTNIQRELKARGINMSIREFMIHVKNTVINLLAGYERVNCGLIEERISSEEDRAIRKLMNEKYMTDEWNFRKMKSYSFHNKCRYDLGQVEVFITIENNCIRDIHFFGDFLSRISLKGFEESFEGCQYKRNDIEKILHCSDLQNLFGGITERELVQLIIG